jgi:hypothetical protein
MKGDTRLAQSLYLQAIEKIRIFDGFSRYPKADSEASTKPDSPSRFSSAKVRPWTGPAAGAGRKSRAAEEPLKLHWREAGVLVSQYTRSGITSPLGATMRPQVSSAAISISLFPAARPATFTEYRYLPGGKSSVGPFACGPPAPAGILIVCLLMVRAASLSPGRAWA